MSCLCKAPTDAGCSVSGGLCEWMAVRLKNNLLYRFFTASEMPKLLAITGFYNIHCKEIVTCRNPFPGTFSWTFRNSACVNTVESNLSLISQFQFQLHTPFASGWEMLANTSLIYPTAISQPPSSIGSPCENWLQNIWQVAKFPFYRNKIFQEPTSECCSLTLQPFHTCT